MTCAPVSRHSTSGTSGSFGFTTCSHRLFKAAAPLSCRSTGRRRDQVIEPSGFFVPTVSTARGTPVAENAPEARLKRSDQTTIGWPPRTINEGYAFDRNVTAFTPLVV